MIQFCWLFIFFLYLYNQLEADFKNYEQSIENRQHTSLIYAKNKKFQTEKQILFDCDRQRNIPIQIYKPLIEEIKDLPIVIVNHGYSVENTEYTFVAEPLSISGYFVISIQHDLPNDPELPRTGNLFEQRKPFWERGVKNILFVLSEIKDIQKNLNFEKIILIGHSNGGDISMLFTSIYPEIVEKVISLDSLRMPFPTKDHIPILTLRANDTKADEGVLPNSGITIVELNNAKHIDMCDRGAEEVKQEIMSLIDMFLKVSPL